MSMESIFFTDFKQKKASETLIILDKELSLKGGFGGCRHKFGGCGRLGGLGGFGGFDGFNGLGEFGRFVF